MKLLLYLYLLITFTSFSFGQNATQTEALALTKKATTATKAGDLSQANSLLKQAANIYAQTENWSAYFDCGVKIVTNHTQAGEYDAGITASKAYIKKAETINYKDISVSLLHKNLGKIYYQQSDDKAALPELEKALTIREAINANDPELARDYGNLGIISRLSGRYSRAIEFLEKAIELQENDNVLARLYTELGTNYKLTGNFRKSLDHQEQALRILEGDSDMKALGLALLEKGATLTELKQKGRDIIHLKQALAIFKKMPTPDYFNQVNCYRRIAYSHSRFAEGVSLLTSLDSAQFFYEKALKIATQHLPKKNTYASKILLDLSAIMAERRDFEQAQRLLAEGETLILTTADKKSLDLFKLFENKAFLNRWQGNYLKALAFHQKQLISIIEDYNEEDLWQLPSIEEAQNSLSHDAITDALAYKARCWYQSYKYGKKDKKRLEAALQTIRLFDQLVDYIRADFSNSGSNIAWSDLTLDAYENAIEICLALAEETNDRNYQKQALYYSEKSKGLSLLETFQNTKAKEVAGLSEKELIQEREMQLDIADLEQEVFQLTQQNNPQFQEAIKKLKKQIFIKKEAYQDFLKNLELNNPQYYNTKYKLEILDLEQMRALLKEDQAFIEYFVGDSSLFAFKITKTEFEAYQLDGQENMLARVGDLRKSIYGYFLSSKDRSEQIKSKFAKQYTDRAYKMYQKLVEPLGSLPKRLIIIPAGSMCDMPFEPLLMQQVSDPEKYKSHPFLIKEHIISYAYSATLLKEMMQKEHLPTKHTYVGFAPSFGKSAASVIRGKRFSLSPLAFNKPEIENINALLGTGTVFKDIEATENQFKAIASDYKIIHFATHGMANSNDPDYSLLAFTEVRDDKENEFLYVSDLYNLELNAEMVVLSACETALGKHFRGEGIMSLARGFSYAGAKSIFTTLWSVNDQSTYTIIKGYYAQLQTGMDKDEALQASKLAYINKANNFTAHPFLWSPYILIGDTNYVPAIAKGFPWMLIGMGIFASIAIGGLLLFLMKKKELI